MIILASAEPSPQLQTYSIRGNLCRLEIWEFCLTQNQINIEQTAQELSQ